MVAMSAIVEMSPSVVEAPQCSNPKPARNAPNGMRNIPGMVEAVVTAPIR